MLSLDPDNSDVAEIADIGGRILVHEKQVGALARLDQPTVDQPEYLRDVSDGSAKDLDRSEPRGEEETWSWAASRIALAVSWLTAVRA